MLPPPLWTSPSIELAKFPGPPGTGGAGCGGGWDGAGGGGGDDSGLSFNILPNL